MVVDPFWAEWIKTATPEQRPAREQIAKICIENDLLLEKDHTAVALAVDKVLMANPKFVNDYRKGKLSVINALYGKCAELIGRYKTVPELVRPILEDRLKTQAKVEVY